MQRHRMPLPHKKLQTQFKFNPFACILDEDVHKVIVPKIDFEELTKTIRTRSNILIEFVGKKGRGKTTHLTLANQLTPESTIFYLNKNFDTDKILECKSKIILIDSIHHIPIRKRNQLFRSQKTILFTTHHSKYIEAKLAGKEIVKYAFKGLQRDELISITNKRFHLATKHKVPTPNLSSKEANKLINKYGDNIRGIINHLYDTHQTS